MIDLVIAFLAGTTIGAAYFAALWWTVRDLPRARRPALRLATSTIVRLVLVVGAFWLVMNGDSGRLVACLAGFIAARFVAMRIVRRAPASPDATEHDASEPPASTAARDGGGVAN